jgi:hypothetical protein
LVAPLDAPLRPGRLRARCAARCAVSGVSDGAAGLPVEARVAGVSSVPVRAAASEREFFGEFNSRIGLNPAEPKNNGMTRLPDGFVTDAYRREVAAGWENYRRLQVPDVWPSVAGRTLRILRDLRPQGLGSA